MGCTSISANFYLFEGLGKNSLAGPGGRAGRGDRAVLAPARRGGGDPGAGGRAGGGADSGAVEAVFVRERAAPVPEKSEFPTILLTLFLVFFVSACYSGKKYQN